MQKHTQKEPVNKTATPATNATHNWIPGNLAVPWAISEKAGTGEAMGGEYWSVMVPFIRSMASSSYPFPWYCFKFGSIVVLIVSLLLWSNYRTRSRRNGGGRYGTREESNLLHGDSIQWAISQVLAGHFSMLIWVKMETWSLPRTAHNPVDKSN